MAANPECPKNPNEFAVAVGRHSEALWDMVQKENLSELERKVLADHMLKSKSKVDNGSRGFIFDKLRPERNVK